MPLELNALVLGLAALGVLNCLVSLRIAFATGATRTQKWLQVALVWFVPLLGALFVFLFYRTDSEPRGPAEPPFGGGAHDGMPGGVQ